MRSRRIVRPLAASVVAGCVVLVPCGGIALAASPTSDASADPTATAERSMQPIPTDRTHPVRSGYGPPTDAPVLDPFRAPPEPWQSGNRGIEYGTAPGSPVRAIGAGRVAFAGVVAGREVVTVDHPDGLRSSYVGDARILVVVGEQVTRETVVVVAAGPIHLGVRRGTTYLDPASLWSRLAGRPILVPLG